MKTICFDVYEFNELSDKAKEKARDWYRSIDTEYAWAAETRESMEAFAQLFPIKVRDWSYGGRGAGVSFEFRDDGTLEEIEGVRLYKWLVNHDVTKLLGGDCPLTGYCMDEDLLDPIRAFVKKPKGTFRELLQDCFDAWIKAAESNVEYQGSDEYIDETIEGSGYTFTIDGKREG